MKHKTRTKALSWLLTLAMFVGLVPGMGLTAYASPTETLLTTITGAGSNAGPATSANISYSAEGVATLTFSEPNENGQVAYQASPAWGWWGYDITLTVTAAEGYTITKCVFYDDKDRTATDSEAPFVVETTEEDKTPQVNGTPILANQSKGITKIEVYGYATPAHTHSFTYTVRGATITATCNADGCTLDDGTEQHKHAVTLTIVKPTLTTYGQTGEGISASATLTGLSDFNTATGLNVQTSSIVYWNAKIQEGVYKTDGDQPLTAAPTSAGNYLAKITVNNCIAAVGYTINRADPTANAPTGLTATYGQTLANVSLEGKNPEGNTPGTWAWADAATTSVGSVGAHTFKANFTPTDTTNYNSKSNVDVTVTVSKADATTAMQAASVSIAGTSGKTATVSYTLPDGASYGTVTNSNTEFFTVDTTSGIVLTAAKNWTASDWATDTSKTFTVLVSGATNYNGYTLTVTVTPTYKATQTITAADVTATYGDTGKSVSATTDGDGAISYAVKSGDAVTVNESTGALTIVKVGSATITVTAAETATYAQATKDVTVTVNPKTMTVSAPNVTATVDGQPHGITVTVTDPATGYTVKYGTTAGEYTLNASPTQTEAGSLTVYYQVTADNYTTYTGSATMTVSDIPTYAVTVTFDSDGGSAVAAQTVASGGKATKPADPTCEGWTFLGWFVDPTLDNIYTIEQNEAGEVTGYHLNTYDFDTAVTADVTLKALWSTRLYVNTTGSGSGRIDAVGTGETLNLDDEYPMQSATCTAIKGLNDTFLVGAKAGEDARFVGWRLRTGVDEDGAPVYADGFYATETQINVKVTGPLSLDAVFEYADPGTHRITGKVTVPKAENGTEYDNVANASVELRQGSKACAAAATDENGNYSFHSVPNGEYNIVVADTNGKTKTEYVKIENADQTVNVVMPYHSVSSKLVVSGETPAAVVAGLDDAAAESLTAEEKTAGAKVTVTMEIESAKDLTGTPDEQLNDGQKREKAEQQAIKNANTGANASEKLDFLDMSVYRITQKPGEAAQTTSVPQTAEVLEMLLPYETLNRTFSIFRTHQGSTISFRRLTTRPVSGFADGTFYVGSGFIVVYGNLFSTYAIGYTEASAPTSYTVTVMNGTGGGSFTAGSLVTITADPAPQGMVFAGWTASGVTLANAFGTTTSFTMPAGSVTVTALYQAIPAPEPEPAPEREHTPVVNTYPVQTEKAEHGAFKASYEQTASGTNVTVTPAPDNGYEVARVVVKDASGRTVTVTRNANGTYSFTMPASRVTVSVEFAAIQTEPYCRRDGSCPVSAFTDADANAWYHDGVHYVLEKGVMSGMGDGRFAPNGTTTRAQLATILWNMEGRPVVNYLMDYADVNAGDWYAEAVRWATSQGLVSGYGDGSFGPNDELTREQLVTILYRYANLKGAAVSPDANIMDYDDVFEVSGWAVEAMRWAVQVKLVEGVGGNKLAPKDSATRAQIATIIMRYCENIAK